MLPFIVEYPVRVVKFEGNSILYSSSRKMVSYHVVDARGRTIQAFSAGSNGSWFAGSLARKMNKRR